MSKIILKVSCLSVDYKSNNSFLFPWEKNKSFRAVDNINFEIKEGETLGIVGETGSGKSTIAKAVINLLKVSSGKIFFQNNQIANLDEKNMRNYRKEIQMIFQDPLASLNPRMNVGEIISEPLKAHYPNLTKNEIKYQVQDIMNNVGLLSNQINRYPHEFSGGQCQRIGIARSLILRPKLIICDEEHDSSYKQEDGPKYQARDMAIYKAKCSKALCLLISASPSLESLHNSNQDKFKIHNLSNQFHKTQLPLVEIVDMNQSKPSSKAWISKQVFDETNKILKQKGQVLFFLNRRGYAPSKICASCHTPIQCQNCAANLVYHKKIDRLVCHHCSNFFEPDQICKMCSSEKFVSIGIGLERLQEEVARLFPGYSNQLISSDTLKSKKNKKDIIENIYNLKTSLLIGSQIIGKSFHFPNLKLVNIIDADSSLYSPDFRAMEKTYQLLQQVAGRSGREGERGKVLIQTYSPQHSIYNSLKNQSRDQFIKLELQRREENNLPPFYKIAQIQLIHPNVSALREVCQEILNISKNSKLDILGPVPSLIPYKMRHFHENFYFKERSYQALRKKTDILMTKITPKYRRFLNIDIDPLSIA
mgnify:CR=1 FL=1